MSEWLLNGVALCCQLAVALAVAIVLMFDLLSFGQLCFTAFVLHLAAQHVPKSDVLRASAAGAAIVMLLYFGYRALQGEESSELIVSLVRALLVYHIARSVLIAVVALARFLVKHARRTTDDLLTAAASGLQSVRAFVRCILRRREQPAPPPPPRPSRSDRMQRFAAAAQAEFEAEQSLLLTLPLDDDEREILILQAKQRLLQKLAQLPEV